MSKIYSHRVCIRDDFNSRLQDLLNFLLSLPQVHDQRIYSRQIGDGDPDSFRGCRLAFSEAPENGATSSELPLSFWDAIV